jgi:hypothetical protein
MSSRFGGAWVALVDALLAGACSDGSPRDGHEVTGAVSAAIVHGSDSPAAQDAVVLVMHYDAIQIGGAAAGCTGTLLTPRLVLTARHCIAETDSSAACDSAGNATFGGVVRGDHVPSKVFAFAGNERPDFLSGLDKAARAAEIIDDDAKSLCNHDIALLLLDRPLPGTKAAPLRLDGGPQRDELVTVVGFGVSEKSSSPQIRQQRTGVKVVAVGPAEGLGPAEFRIGESTCSGDSGGPAFAESGAVLGVLSRGGNQSGAKSGDVAACIAAENVFTSVSHFKDLVLGAYAKAGQEPWYEGQPDPTLPKPPPPPEEEKRGCAISRSYVTSCSAWCLVAMALVVACASRRRTRS